MSLKTAFGSYGTNSPFVNLLIGVLCGVAAFLLMQNLTDSRNAVLAEVAGTSLHRRDIGVPVEDRLRGLEFQEYETLARATDLWIESTVIAKEAAAHSMKPEELVQKEIRSKIQVPREEAYRRYAASPAAEPLKPEEALAAILKDLQSREFVKQRKIFIDGLSSKYAVKSRLKPPAGYPSNRSASAPAAERFPVYQVPPAKPELDAGGNVVAPPSLGPKNAPILIEVFSDFMCPFSARFSKTTSQIHQNYPDKARIEFRHFPLPFHQGSDQIAEASLCAQEQGKFWSYHDALFAGAGPKTKEELISLATSLGLDKERFGSCVESRKYKTLVLKDVEEGRKRGANGTPSYFVNGRTRSGAVPYEQAKLLIDWLLDPKGAVPDRKPQAPNPQAARAATPPYAFKESDLEKSPSQGPASAPVTLIEFIDYKCGFCKRAVPILNDIVAHYGQKIRFVSKNFPLSDATKPFATAAACANGQGQYWKYREALFAMEGGVSSSEELVKKAGELKLNTAKFKACLEDPKSQEAVEKDRALGIAAQVQGTPTYYVNGGQITGADTQALHTAIDSELAKSQKKS